MEEIAKRAGIAKGSVFTYFGSKEEIFLGITVREFGAWADYMKEGLLPLTENPTNDNLSAVTTLLGRSLDRFPLLFSLLGILHIILENNQSFEAIDSFKRSFHLHLTGLVMILELLFPALSGNGLRFIMLFYAQIIGLQHLSHPSEMALEVLASDEMYQVYRIDFKESVLAAFRLLLKGFNR